MYPMKAAIASSYFFASNRSNPTTSLASAEAEASPAFDRSSITFAERSAKVMEDLSKAGDASASADARLVVGFERFEAKKYDEAIAAFMGYIDARPKGEDTPRALAYLAL